MCVILSRRCLWQLSAVFEQQSQSVATAAMRVVVTALVGDCAIAPPLSALHLLLLLLLFLLFSSNLPSPPVLASSPLLQLKWLTLHQFHHSWGRTWIDSPPSPANLLQLQISFSLPSKSLLVQPWKQGVPVPPGWPWIALLQYCLGRKNV